MSHTWLSYFIIPTIIQGIYFRDFCLFSLYYPTVRSICLRLFSPFHLSFESLPYQFFMTIILILVTHLFKNNGKLTFVQGLLCEVFSLSYLILKTIWWNKCYAFLNLSKVYNPVLSELLESRDDILFISAPSVPLTLLVHKWSPINTVLCICSSLVSAHLYVTSKYYSIKKKIRSEDIEIGS